MPWFKIDDGFTNSKPVLRIPRRHRAPAIGLWTLAGAWSAKELTDGHIAAYLIDEFASTNAMAGQLVKADLWEVADDGWQFRNWATYQPTREQVLADREKEAERKRKYRESKSATGPTRPSGMSDRGPTRSVAVSTTSDPNARNPSSLADPDSHTPTDLPQHELSQWDTNGTNTGRTVGHQAESGHPDPTRPDPTRPVTTDVVTESPKGDAPRTPDLIAEWIEHCDDRPPSRVIGQISKEVKSMLTEGIEYERVRAGLAEWNRKGLHPSTLASVVHELTTKKPAPSKADQRMRANLAVVEQLRAEEATQLRAIEGNR